jgi:hypothetical protein
MSLRLIEAKDEAVFHCQCRWLHFSGLFVKPLPTFRDHECAVSLHEFGLLRIQMRHLSQLCRTPVEFRPEWPLAFAAVVEMREDGLGA